jgi:hypothetical protein
MVLDTLTAEDFRPHLYEIFHIRLDGIDPIDLELITVTEQVNHEKVAHRLPFALLFLGPVSDQYLLQHIYHVEHAQIEALDIFIVPLGLQDGRMRYEAIFN